MKKRQAKKIVNRIWDSRDPFVHRRYKLRTLVEANRVFCRSQLRPFTYGSLKSVIIAFKQVGVAFDEATRSFVSLKNAWGPPKYSCIESDAAAFYEKLGVPYEAA